MTDLPRNAMGKVQKNLLRQAHAKPFAASTSLHRGAFDVLIIGAGIAGASLAWRLASKRKCC